MNKLTCFEDIPIFGASANSHFFRRLGSSVFISNEGGAFDILSESEYRQMIAGRRRSIEETPDAVFKTSLLSWRGPSRHVLLLEREGAKMGLETARLTVDFAFSLPGPQVSLEMAADEAASVWPVVWFIVQYGRRKSEWTKRPLSLTLRAGKSLAPAQVGFLTDHGVALRLEMALEGAPAAGLRPLFAAQRALCRMGKAAIDPAAWVDWLSEQGVKSVRLEPAPGPLTEQAARRFLRFYGAFLDRLIETDAARSFRDEWICAFLSRKAWGLPGMDVLEQLCYDSTGEIFSSEAALAMARDDSRLFSLGPVENARYENFGGSAVVRAVAASAWGDNQPLCFQCAYRPFCALPPSLNYRAQSTTWGQTPSSLLCSLQMGVLDQLFTRWKDARLRSLVDRWGIAR
jgi:hypothetical protein